jgi:iron-sulfur cluster assembly protein
MITLTPKAQSAIDKFIKGPPPRWLALRIAISGGGCSGFQYGMKLEEAKAEDDVVVDWAASPCWWMSSRHPCSAG